MQEAHFHKRDLPHFYIDKRIYFITARLKDSIPAAKIMELKTLQEKQQAVLSENEEKDLKTTNIFNHYDELLDKAQYGTNHLASENIASIVYDAIMHNHKKHYILYCFCIMPNHIHIVFEHIDNSKSITEIMKVIKGYSARKANQLLNRKGPFWQPESYDRIIRDDDELNNTINYVLMNPVKAKLVDKYKDWKFTYLNKELFDLA